jgi:rhodanese-related sulfurtransferase
MNRYIIRLFVIIIGGLLITSACTCPCSKQVANADDIVNQYIDQVDVMSTEQLKTMMDSLEIFYLIDVREINEYAYGFVPGAINVPGGVLIFKMENTAFWDNEMIYPPMKTDKIIVYCKKGKRSVIAAHDLQRLGYENVWYLDGGYKAWEMAYPLLYEENLEMFGNAHDESADEGGC